MRQRNNRVFLGGTCNGSTWRDELIPLLKIDYFNPVVEDWTLEAQAEEIRQRQECQFVLYTITPLMSGVYSIAEVVDDSNKRPNRTILCVLLDDGDKVFGDGPFRSLQAVARMVEKNGGVVLWSLQDVADYLNRQGDPDATT